MRKHITIYILLCILLSCSSPTPTSIKNTIAVVDFTNNARYDAPYMIEGVATEIFSSLLAGTNKFRVLERNKIYSLIEEQQLNSTDLFNHDKAVKMGRLLGAQYIATGSIMEMGTKIKTFSGYGVNTKNITYKIAIEIKIIDIERGELIFTDITSDSKIIRQSGNLSTTQGEEVYKELIRSALLKSINKLLIDITGEDKI